MHETERPAMSDSEPPQGPISFEEASRLYRWQWVLLKVTDIDERGVITHGVVVDHSRHRGKLNRAVKRLHRQEPDAHIFIFLGGTRFGAGDELRRALSEIAERDDIDAGR